MTTSKRRSKPENKDTGKYKLMQIDINKLKPFPNNPRKITAKVMGQLIASIEQYGMVQPLVVDQHYRIVGGWQRSRAAKKLGYKTVPCVITKLGDKEAAKLNLSLNRLHGDFDYEQLAYFLDQYGDDIAEDAGFSSTEIDDLAELMKQAEDDLDTAEIEEETKKRVEFDATVSTNAVRFKVGSLAGNINQKYFDRFYGLFDHLVAQEKVQNEVEFMQLVIKTAYKNLRVSNE